MLNLYRAAGIDWLEVEVAPASQCALILGSERKRRSRNSYDHKYQQICGRRGRAHHQAQMLHAPPAAALECQQGDGDLQGSPRLKILVLYFKSLRVWVCMHMVH